MTEAEAMGCRIALGLLSIIGVVAYIVSGDWANGLLFTLSLIGLLASLVIRG